MSSKFIPMTGNGFSISFKLIILTVAAIAAATANLQCSEALFLGNIIGCNSLACRLSSLENDVGQLKQQVARIEASHSHNGNMFNPNSNSNSNTNTNFRPNSMMNPQNQGNQLNNQPGQQQQLNQNNLNSLESNGSQQQDNNNPNRVNYANLLATDYPATTNQQLRRVPGYQNIPNGGQYYRL